MREDHLGRWLKQRLGSIVPRDCGAGYELRAQSPSGDEVENRRYRGARHGAADVQIHPTGVELEEGQWRFGYELADRGAPPP